MTQQRLLAAPGSAETIDVVDVMRTVRRQWVAVLSGLAVGLMAALLVVLFAPRRFEGRTTVLARPGTSGSGSIGNRISGIGELMGGLAELGGGGSIETELQMLRSRALAGQLVDSLRLQVRVHEPEGIAPLALVERIDFPGAFKPVKIRFERQADGTYRATSALDSAQVTPGRAVSLSGGSLTLRGQGLPARFELTLLDHEDAVTRTVKRFTITKAGGDIARVVYQGDDSVTAAAGANALVKFYLDRRKTTDRSANERRVEYVTAQFDSTARALAATERELRRYQEASGIVDAEEVGRIDLETAAALRRSYTEAQVDEGAIKQLLAQADGGRISSRDLAAYPKFLLGSSVSPLVAQLTMMESQRFSLLERRTERDPEVQALDKSMRAVEASILAMARSYADAVSRQREQMGSRLDTLQRAMSGLPAAAERGGRLQRDVERLTAIFTALEAQLIEARLAAIGEGGNVRQVDVAVPQRKPSSPKPVLTLGLGAAAGLFSGVVAALFLGWFGPWLRDPREIERAVGVSAQQFEPHLPLLVAGASNARTVLVAPIDTRVGVTTVVEGLARTARQRSLQAVIVDLTGNASGNGAGALTDYGAMLERMERENGMVIVQLPSLTSEAAAATMNETRPVLLVAPPGPVDRARLSGAVDLLRRLQVPCAGVVISGVADVPGRPRALT
jgi:uncharacterized protein involved in exopolysaccharide biosynthesis